MDRASWSIYANFQQIYDQVYDQMEDAGLVVKFSIAKQMKKDGIEVLKEGSFGCMVTHELKIPEICIVMDEMGGNTNQKVDGNKGGQLMICGKDMVPQIKASTKDKHFTLLGLTALNVDPVMCILIIAGKRETKLYDCGMDIFAEKLGDVSNADFFENNSGPGKRFPGGPNCTFQGKNIPCLV